MKQRDVSCRAVLCRGAAWRHGCVAGRKGCIIQLWTKSGPPAALYSHEGFHEYQMQSLVNVSFASLSLSGRKEGVRSRIFVEGGERKVAREEKREEERMCDAKYFHVCLGGPCRQAE